MARQSSAALSIVPPTRRDGRLPVPDGLSATEAELWRETIDSKPAEWFGPDSAPVLKEYVRAATMCDALAELLSNAMASDEPGVRRTIPDLLLARDREARRAANLATKLRLTQQSRYTPQAAATANKRAAGKRPWQS